MLFDAGLPNLEHSLRDGVHAQVAVSLSAAAVLVPQHLPNGVQVNPCPQHCAGGAVAQIVEVQVHKP